MSTDEYVAAIAAPLFTLSMWRLGRGRVVHLAVDHYAPRIVEATARGDQFMMQLPAPGALLCKMPGDIAPLDIACLPRCRLCDEWLAHLERSLALWRRDRGEAYF